jgi:hypothetical protein
VFYGHPFCDFFFASALLLAIYLQPTQPRVAVLQKLISRSFFAALGGAAIEEACFAGGTAVGAEADQTVKDFFDEPDTIGTAD